MTYEKKGRYIVEFQDIPKARQHHIEIPVEERIGNNNEVELGFDEERALKEAKRCLSCRRCLGCALCWAECKPEAINFEMQDEYLDLEADTIIVSPGVERPLNRVAPHFGLGKNQNVMTDLQMERMLSQTGPSGGLVLRPYDGEIPMSVAFVQGYASASPQMHKSALFLGINEAILVRRKLPSAQISFFAQDLASFMEEQKDALKALDKIEVREAAVTALESLENQSLQLTIGSNGSQETKSFDLVVILTQPQLAPDVKNLSKKLGLDMSYASFLAQEGSGLISTAKDTLKLTAIL
jgi:heterodisulfide reductase subunit A-like polyferredoxin